MASNTPAPYEFNLPFAQKGDINEYQADFNKVAASHKSTIIDAIEKNSPAHIAVVGYQNNSFTGKKHFLSNKFFLQGISEAGQEKLQVIETFDTPRLLFFNQRMKAYNFRGLFLDGDSPDSGISNYWADAFRRFYENHLRGTKLVDNNSIAVLTVNNQMYIGYPTTLQLGIDSQRPLLDTFSMTWAITQVIALPPIAFGGVTSNTTVDLHLKNLDALFKASSIDTDPAKTEEIRRLRSELRELVDKAVGLTILIDDKISNMEAGAPTEQDQVVLNQYELSMAEVESRIDSVVADLVKYIGIMQ